jgi:hypothetical protein
VFLGIVFLAALLVFAGAAWRESFREASEARSEFRAGAFLAARLAAGAFLDDLLR